MISGRNVLDRQLLRGGDKMDYPLLWVTLILLAFGLMMVYSATVSGKEMLVIKEQGKIVASLPYYYLQRQMIFVGAIGVLCMAAFGVRMSLWKQLTPYLVGISVAMLVAVLFLGVQAGGARRWLSLGIVNLQPAEMFKVAVIMYLASFLTRRVDILLHFKKVWYVAWLPALGIVLIYLSGDLGSVVIIAGLTVTLLFLGGLRLKWFISAIAFGAVAVTAAIITTPYRLRRVLAFRDPLADPYGDGFQLSHALSALANGGWLGKGLGNSLERFYLPEIHTDFILALIAEELGIVSVLLMIGVFAWMVWRAFSIGKQARDLELYFSAYVAKGVGIWLGMQSFFHIGVNIGLLPTKGLTLPFISYGGSSLLVTMAAMTLLLRIDYENRRKMRGFRI
ncbi:MAG: putative lipid II flippase FtsW [Neisseria sp.]|nr:putative lipid II flippase FtsW [Neisseria sp.]